MGNSSSPLTRMEESQWFLAKSNKAPAVVLLIHGLNQRPSSWTQLIEELNDLGLHVYRLSLKGHRGLPSRDMEEVSSDIWLNEFHEGYAQTHKRFPGLPLYLVAYSMGALIAMTGQLQAGKSLFARQLLLAPALSIRPYTKLILQFTRFFSWFPSRASGHYVANAEGTSASATRRCFSLRKHFALIKISTLSIPLLVLLCDQMMNSSVSEAHTDFSK